MADTALQCVECGGFLRDMLPACRCDLRAQRDALQSMWEAARRERDNALDLATAAELRHKEIEGKLQAALAENAELRRQVECWVAWNDQGRPTVADVLEPPR